MKLVHPEALSALAQQVGQAGGRAYLVGGGVRDHLLGHDVKDWDVEVFGLAMSQLVRILRSRGSVNAVGRSFGVLKWRPHDESTGEIDVSIPRRDSKVGPGHRGISVEGDPDMSVDEAVRRRDLTINAMMWDLSAGQLVDPAGGQSDLAAKQLRAVDVDTFLEDPLRALRVVQFAARLQFSVHATLLELCRRAALDELPAERVQLEWGKLLLRGASISTGFAVARQSQVLQRVFPEAAHLDADAVLDRLVADARGALPSEGQRWAVMLAGWLHAATPAQTKATLDRLWIHTVGGVNVRALVTALVEHWRAPVTTDAELRQASVPAPLRLSLPLRAAVHDQDLSDAWHRAEAMGILDRKPPPLIQGRDLKELGMAPGPRMGEVLRELYALQLQGTLGNEEEARSAARTLLDDG
ncbi:MAG: hypothetical protein KTR31_06055 [Myxococcales bacterium]|nr:hypothetical protein [Myxococcales bacterium]